MHTEEEKKIKIGLIYKQLPTRFTTEVPLNTFCSGICEQAHLLAVRRQALLWNVASDGAVIASHCRSYPMAGTTRNHPPVEVWPCPVGRRHNAVGKTWKLSLTSQVEQARNMCVGSHHGSADGKQPEKRLYLQCTWKNSAQVEWEWFHLS